ncbi:ABC transporter ATP-binding protein [Streptomyces sp. NPDC021020]|uniref:ABC transporter ATP-binding protein n=1 Tax=Streptomyces sp. NPDC021020 TaxID=3365109 RepID=UPI00379C0BF9
MDAALAPLLGIGGALLLSHVLDAVKSVLEHDVSQQIDGRLRARVRRLSLRPETITHIEDPRFQDDLVRAADIGLASEGRERSPGMAAAAQLSLLARLVSAVFSALVLARYSWLLAVAILAAAVATRAVLRRQWLHLASVSDAAAPVERRTRYWSSVLSGSRDAKEVRLYGLARYFGDLRTRDAQRWIDTYLTELRGVLRGQHWALVLAGASAFTGMLLPALAASSGSISVSLLASSLVAAWAILAISFIGREAFDIERGVKSYDAVVRLTAEGRQWSVAEHGRAPLRTAQPGIRFDGVCFGYPGSDRRILDGLDLEVRAGEVTAIVGGNGVGKTTLIKLLSGLYRPTSGRILLDGQDLADVDLTAWRRRLAVVFQDFVHYPLSVGENIRLSAPEQAADEQALRDALLLAGATDVLSGREGELGSSLWSGGTGADGLSGGQWQQLAIARAVYALGHGRTCVVLDEPTAHLDVRAETRFYQQVVTSLPGATVLLISHRLSTVRHADRILVLRDGRLAEQGNHRELMAHAGEYARLFALQAERFHLREAAS